MWRARRAWRCAFSSDMSGSMMRYGRFLSAKKSGDGADGTGAASGFPQDYRWTWWVLFDGQADPRGATAAADAKQISTHDYMIT